MNFGCDGTRWAHLTSRENRPEIFCSFNLISEKKARRRRWISTLWQYVVAFFFTQQSILGLIAPSRKSNFFLFTFSLWESPSDNFIQQKFHNFPSKGSSKKQQIGETFMLTQPFRYRLIYEIKSVGVIRLAVVLYIDYVKCRKCAFVKR